MERLNFQLDSPKSAESLDGVLSKRRGLRNKRSCNLSEIIRWIKNKRLDSGIEQELIKIAKGYPSGAMNQFKARYLDHLKALRKK